MAKGKRRKAAAKKSKKRVPRVKRVRKTTTRPRAAGIDSVVAGLQKYRDELVNQRAGLDAQIQAVEQALSAMGTAAGPAPRRAAGRPRRATAGGYRAGSLKDCIADVLSGGGVMAVRDITDGVLKAGYKTKNKTLAKSVGIALTEMKNVTKVGRGRFKAK